MQWGLSIHFTSVSLYRKSGPQLGESDVHVSVWCLLLVLVFNCGNAMRIGYSFCQCVLVSLIRSLPHHRSPCRLSSQANSFNIATAIDPTYHRRQNQHDDMHAATQMKTVVPVSRSLPLAGKLCSLQETWWTAVSVDLPVNRIKLPAWHSHLETKERYL